VFYRWSTTSCLGTSACRLLPPSILPGWRTCRLQTILPFPAPWATAPPWVPASPAYRAFYLGTCLEVFVCLGLHYLPALPGDTGRLPFTCHSWEGFCCYRLISVPTCGTPSCRSAHTTVTGGTSPPLRNTTAVLPFMHLPFCMGLCVLPFWCKTACLPYLHYRISASTVRIFTVLPACILFCDVSTLFYRRYHCLPLPGCVTTTRYLPATCTAFYRTVFYRAFHYRAYDFYHWNTVLMSYLEFILGVLSGVEFWEGRFRAFYDSCLFIRLHSGSRWAEFPAIWEVYT